MAVPRKHFSEKFKRQAVARMTDDPGGISTIARQLGVSRSALFKWRNQYTAPPASPLPASAAARDGVVVSPLPEGEGPGVRAGREAPGVTSDPQSPEVTATSAHDPRLRQALMDTAFALTAGIRGNTDSAPLNQLVAALGIVLDRLIRLEALASAADETEMGEQLIRIQYTYPDGTVHFRPPWAPDNPAFELPVTPNHVRSPFWDNQDDEQADGPEEYPSRG